MLATFDWLRYRRGMLHCNPTKLRTLPIVFLVLVLLSAQVAWAHPNHGSSEESGLVAGLSHPWMGPDHLLAMFAVGLLSVQFGGPAIWTLPLAFLSIMTVGGVVGIETQRLPGVELGIALSVVFLGLAIAVGKKWPLLAAAPFIGVFGFMHGYAHGVEIPAKANPIPYVIGFFVATALLHLSGVGVGLIAEGSAKRRTIVRIGGAVICAIGVLFVIKCFA